MSRTAIVATMVTSIFALSSPSLAASDEDLNRIGEKVQGAFRCSTYAAMFDPKESDRLFQIGLKAARDFVEGTKNSDNLSSEWVTFLKETSTDFMVGTMWLREQTAAHDEIVTGLSLKESLDPPVVKNKAELTYRKSDCSLIQ